MKMKVRIEGVADIRRKLRAMGGALPRERLLPVMHEHLQPMADDMKARARRKTGRMADSVTVSDQLSPAQAATHEPIAEVETFVGPGPLPEAIQEEFGNFRQGPHPFIRPGFDSNADTAMRRIGDDGIAIILDAARKG
jgi:hypothetical protein